jgi:hypothetical protein
MTVNCDGQESPLAESKPPLLELANALTALGIYLAAAKDGMLSIQSVSKLDQVLDKTVTQHQRAVRAARQLQDEFRRSNKPRQAALARGGTE